MLVLKAMLDPSPQTHRIPQTPGWSASRPLGCEAGFSPVCPSRSVDSYTAESPHCTRTSSPRSGRQTGLRTCSRCSLEPPVWRGSASSSGGRPAALGEGWGWGRGGGWVCWMRQNEKCTFWETRRTCKRIKSKSLRGFYLVAGPCFQDCGPARSWQCPDCHSCCTRGVRCGFLSPAKRWKQQDAVKTRLLRHTIGPLWCRKGHPACLSDHVTTPSVRCWHQHHL